MGKSLNEKIFENGKIFQYQEINESQEIINHIAINLFTEKTCFSDISEIKKKFKSQPPWKGNMVDIIIISFIHCLRLLVSSFS